MNNPVKFTDPDGMGSYDENGMWHSEMEDFWNTHGYANAPGQNINIADSSLINNSKGDPNSGGGGTSGTIGELLDTLLSTSGDGYEPNFEQFDFTQFGGPGPKYTAQHYALIQGLSTVANKLFGIPFTLNKLTESEKQTIFKQSARKTTAILMYEYASGTGPENRNFFPGDALTEDIKWSNSSARATTMFANDYNAGKIKDGDIKRYYIGSSPDKIGITGSVAAHLKGLADQSIWRGGMVYDMQKRGNRLYVKVFDQYNVSSGISRNDADAFRRGNTITPLGTTTINIHFNYLWINTK